MIVFCKNCYYKYKGNFCHHCGQKAATHEIDFKFVLHEVPHSAFHVDKGILYTIKEITLRPGKTIRNYIEGQRVNHFPPLTYVILITSVYVIIKKMQIFFHFDELKSAQKFQSEHRSAFFISIIPFYAFVYWLFHRKFGYNYWKCLLAQTYMTGHLVLIVLIPNILFFAFPTIRDTTKDLFIAVGFGYFAFAYFQMHKDSVESKWKLLFREVICLVIASLFSLGLITLVFGFLSNNLSF